MSLTDSASADASSHADPTAANLAYVESLYAQYLQDPTSVDAHWRQTFAQWAIELNGSVQASGQSSGQLGVLGPSFKPRSIYHGQVPGQAATPQASPELVAQHKVGMFTRNFRVRGHIIADINPLNPRSDDPDELKPEFYGFSEQDMDQVFSTTAIPGKPAATLREIAQHMRDTYCRKVAVQFMHIDDLQVRNWLQNRMESTRNTVELSRKEQVRVLTRLTDAVIFEEFIQRKFIGAKSFSLEGGEALIPLLDLAFEAAGEQGCKEIVLGMAHRGRLNVLANIMGKSPSKIFREFQDVDPQLYIGGGDVKYHMGYSSEWRTRGGQDIHLSLCFNPSHLEFVNPVALGRMRAKQDLARHSGLYNTRGEGGFVVQIHGDAAFIGEGIVQETLNLSELHGYKTGGTLHIVVNNQIGFTTPSHQSRSTRYCTDIAKMLQIPIIHVDGESPEAVAAAVRLAMDFRHTFKRDVVIDMYCFRRRGHNESDEPTYTQPTMYKKIAKHPSVRTSYLNGLKRMGGVTDEDGEQIVKRRTQLLEEELATSKSHEYVAQKEQLVGPWGNLKRKDDESVEEVETGIDQDLVKHLLDHLTSVPEGFQSHPKLKRFLGARKEMALGDKPIDWATGEALAFASILLENRLIRLSGQDAQRGTFSQRHLVLHDYETDAEYRWFRTLKKPDGSPATGHMTVLNSPLSEAGVLGFEYGYSLDTPDGLIIWEAQFGDFVNVAQVIIDQFITSAEDKWNRFSGLVMMLPHGFEGQGPEHSSARLERFLNQCTEDNIQVVYPSTPAQLFHVLRRQIMRPFRKPLIIMTPKSMLRLPACSSPLKAFSFEKFKRVIPDRGGADGEGVPVEGVKRVLLCSGKIYYELIDYRQKHNRQDVAIVRLEQFYPYPKHGLGKALSIYPNIQEVVWVQEEPSNMGGWHFVKLRSPKDQLIGKYPLYGVSRPPSASPATGSRAAHLIEQERVITTAFEGTVEDFNGDMV